MNFVIGDYSSHTQTESLYLNAILRTVGCSSKLWQRNSESAYDLFDTVRPDYYLTHISQINTDALFYIQEAGKPYLILNISGASQEMVGATDNLIKEYGGKISFLFTNSDEAEIIDRNKIINLGFGADMFLSDKSNLEYKIEKAFIMVDSYASPKNENKSYHTLTCNPSLSKDVDICLPITQMSNLYQNYEKVIFKNCTRIIPQIVYDAIHKSNFLYFDIEDKEKRETVSKKLKKIFRTDMDLCDEASVDMNELKSILFKRHTCYHRAKSLLSQLPAKDQLDKIDVLIEGIQK